MSNISLTNPPVAATRAARPKRLLFIVENLPVPFDRRVWSQATTLKDAGYDVSIICPRTADAPAAYEEREGVRIYRHPMPEAKSAKGYLIEYSVALAFEFALALRIMMTRGFDVIHACNPPDLIFLIGAFFKCLFGCRFVFDHHDINPELYEAKFNRRDLLWKLMIFLERTTFRLADISIATNLSYRKIAIERGGMAPERVHVVRSGPRLDRVQSRPPDATWRNGRRFLVGYVGVIGAQEGIDLLLEAVAALVARGRTDVQFVVVGDGPALSGARSLATRMRLDDCVTFVGRVDDEVLFTILSTADVCVNPDRPNAMNDSSTMNKILEYMALGKPIVQFDLREGRFSAQQASLYARNTDPVDFADKIVALLDDPELRARMGEFGRRRVVEELSWQYEAPKIVRAYEQLFGLRP